MRLLSAVDTMFYRMESERTPMHIGALMTFRLSDGALDCVRPARERTSAGRDGLAGAAAGTLAAPAAVTASAAFTSDAATGAPMAMHSVKR